MHRFTLHSGHKRPFFFALTIAISAATMAGCSGADRSDADGESGITNAQSQALQRADDAYRAELEAFYDDYDRVAEQKGLPKVTRPSTSAAGSGGLTPNAWGRKSGRQICDALQGFLVDSKWSHPYFFVGGALDIGAAAHANLGADIVFDLSNQQAGTFWYWGLGVATNAAVSGSVYGGYAAADKANVIDAWSGVFTTTTGSFAIPGTKLGVAGSYFQSPDTSLQGFSGGVSLGVGVSASTLIGLAVGVPLPGIDAQKMDGFWTPFDHATGLIDGAYGFVSHEKVRAVAADGREYDYIQFKGASPLKRAGRQAVAITVTMGVVGPAGIVAGAEAGGVAIALAAARESSDDIAAICRRL